MIRGAYERLFAAFYGWSLKVDGNAGDYNVYYAVFSLSVTLFLNILTAGLIGDMLSPVPFVERAADVSKVWWAMGMIAFTASQCFYFRSGYRYRKVIAAYVPTEKHLAQGPHWKLVAYMVFSVVALVGMAFFGMK